MNEIAKGSEEKKTILNNLKIDCRELLEKGKAAGKIVEEKLKELKAKAGKSSEKESVCACGDFCKNI
jgi:uncharacterized protein (DUF342 family)